MMPNTVTSIVRLFQNGKNQIFQFSVAQAVDDGDQ